MKKRMRCLSDGGYYSLIALPRKTEGRMKSMRERRGEGRRRGRKESAISESSDPRLADFLKTIYSFVVCIIRDEGSS